jgi:hypothetical protein
MSLNDPVSRRKFLKSSALLLGAAAVALVSCGTAAAAIAKPQLEQGLQIGDVVADGAVIWSRSDRPARLIVEHDVSRALRTPSRARAIRARNNRLHRAPRPDRSTRRQRNPRAGDVSRSVERSHPKRPDLLSFPHGAYKISLDPLPVERRYGGPRLGDKRGIRRDENL